jgi:hypothetical protein
VNLPRKELVLHVMVVGHTITTVRYHCFDWGVYRLFHSELHTMGVLAEKGNISISFISEKTMGNVCSKVWTRNVLNISEYAVVYNWKCSIQSESEIYFYDYFKDHLNQAFVALRWW